MGVAPAGPAGSPIHGRVRSLGPRRRTGKAYWSRITGRAYRIDIVTTRGSIYNTRHMDTPAINLTGKDTVMKTLGLICLFSLIALFAVGASFGQTDPVEENTGQAEAETNEPDETPPPTVSRSVNHTPFGVRAGYTSWKNLDQFHVGGHVYLGELWPNVEFTPGFEVGFGNSATVLTINGDVTYLFTEFVGFPWGLYGGGSLSFNLMNPDGGDSETDLGLSGLVGTTYTFVNDHKGMAEIRFGIMDSPSFKLTFGYTLF